MIIEKQTESRTQPTSFIKHRNSEKEREDRQLEKKNRPIQLESISVPSQTSNGSIASTDGIPTISSTNSLSTIDNLKVIVRMTDMPESMQTFAFETVKEAKRRISSNTTSTSTTNGNCGIQDLAKRIKLEFDKTYQGNWHCIVGSDFGSFITHETNNMIFFYIGREAFLIWKTA